MSSSDNQYSNQKATLSDFALGELQLRHQPFTTKLDDEASGKADKNETFVDSIAEAQLDDIKQALISGDDLLLILGPEGSGKSTLLNQLGSKSGQRIQCFSVLGSERFSTANLFAGMIEAFKKQPPDDLKLMLDELIPCLQVMADHNTLGTVVLDDADLIPETELTKLLSGMLYLNSSDETLLRVTLAAPTEFEERIPDLLPEGADLPYSSLAIEAFDKVRSAAYLDYRLQQAGMTAEFPFNDNQIATINEQAGGRPGLLHTVAAWHLNARDKNFKSELSPEFGTGQKKAVGDGLLGSIGGTKLIVGALALAMILLGLFWLKPNNDDVPDDRYKVVENKKLETEKVSETQALQLAEKRKATEKLAAEKRAAENLSEQNQSNQPDATGSNNKAQTNNSSEDDSSIVAAKAEAAKAETQRLAKLESETAQKVAIDKLAKEKLAAEQTAQAKLAEEQAAQAKLAEEQAAQDKLAEEQAAQAKLAEEQAAQDKLAEEQAAQDKLAEEQAAKAKLAKEQANESKITTTAAANSPPDEVESDGTVNMAAALNNLESPNWILVQNPALFTVQMSASKDRESVENFLASTGLKPPNSVFSFQRDGATWFALVHGLYDNIEEARKDIEKMPANARSNQPWIRAVGRIQKAMKEQ